MNDRSSEVRRIINNRLIETGEKERLKEKLKNRLTESGWKDDMKAHAKDIVKERGLNQITVDDLVRAITPRGRESVPTSVKQELLSDIKDFWENHVRNEKN
ncbi:Transcription factor enhancer of yellow 2 [Trinorchestia longiramus]|nr:Transcription factor enhancer of yellow 2 [Trinorchestia longiramus]